jgi:hypothetical protein
MVSDGKLTKRGAVIQVTKLGSGRPQKVQRGCRGQGPGNEWDTDTTVSRWQLTRPTWLSTDPTTHLTTAFGSAVNLEYICNIWRWYKCVVLFNILWRICGLKLVRLHWFSKFKQCAEICHDYKLETIELMFVWHKCNHTFCIGEHICGMYILYSHILPIAILFQICTVTFVTFANWFSCFKFLQEFATAVYKFTNDNITKALRIDLQQSQILRRLPCQKVSGAQNLHVEKAACSEPIGSRRVICFVVPPSLATLGSPKCTFKPLERARCVPTKTIPKAIQIHRQKSGRPHLTIREEDLLCTRWTKLRRWLTISV